MVERDLHRIGGGRRCRPGGDGHLLAIPAALAPPFRRGCGTERGRGDTPRQRDQGERRAYPWHSEAPWPSEVPTADRSVEHPTCRHLELTCISARDAATQDREMHRLARPDTWEPMEKEV